MECAARVAEAVLAGGQLAEVPRSFRHDVVVEPEHDAAGGLGVDGDVELREERMRTLPAAQQRTALTNTRDLHRRGAHGAFMTCQLA